MKHVSLMVFLGIIGLIIGYLVFGNMDGKLLSIGDIFGSNGNTIEQTAKNVAGIATAREKILIAGAIGAVIGVFLSVFAKRNSDRE